MKKRKIIIIEGEGFPFYLFSFWFFFFVFFSQGEGTKVALFQYFVSARFKFLLTGKCIKNTFNALKTQKKRLYDALSDIVTQRDVNMTI